MQKIVFVLQYAFFISMTVSDNLELKTKDNEHKNTRLYLVFSAKCT